MAGEGDSEPGKVMEGGGAARGEDDREEDREEEPRGTLLLAAEPRAGDTGGHCRAAVTALPRCLTEEITREQCTETHGRAEALWGPVAGAGFCLCSPGSLRGAFLSVGELEGS